MRILGIESADKIASVAILDDDKLIGEVKSDGTQTHSVTLMPMLDKLVKDTLFDLKNLDVIAISKGPGSYTGLRIGASTAKGLALVIKKPLVPVSTLLAMASAFWGTGYLVVPMIDARRGNVFSSAYFFKGSGKDAEVVEILDENLYNIDILLEHIKTIADDLSKEVVFLGSGSKNHSEKIASILPDNSYIAPSTMDEPKASFVAMCGSKLYKQGKAIDGKDFAPNYLRPSQAERNKNGK